jgi:hypothetical protein
VAALSRAVRCLGGEIRAQREEIRVLREALECQRETPPKVVGTREVAGLNGRHPDYVRENAKKLGGWNENGPGSRWRFYLGEAVERYRRGLGEAE